jgi:hypothetical protein
LPFFSLKDLPHTSMKIETNIWKKPHNIYVAKQILI